MDHIRLGANEKKILQAFLSYQYQNDPYPCSPFKRSIASLEQVITFVNRNNRSVYPRVIHSLHEKKLICILEETPENLDKFIYAHCQPIIYGRGIYKKLIGLTKKGKLAAEKIRKKTIGNTTEHRLEDYAEVQLLIARTKQIFNLLIDAIDSSEHALNSPELVGLFEFFFTNNFTQNTFQDSFTRLVIERPGIIEKLRNNLHVYNFLLEKQLIN